MLTSSLWRWAWSWERSESGPWTCRTFGSFYVSWRKKITVVL